MSGLFIAVDDSGHIAKSSDGLAWLQQTVAPSTFRFYRIIFGNGLAVAIGIENGNGDCQAYVSSDGATWAHTTIASPAPGASILPSLVFGAGQFVAIITRDLPSGFPNYDIYTSPDGQAWTFQSTIATGPTRQSNSATSATFGLGLYVIGEIGGRIWTSPDTITWTEQVSPWIVGSGQNGMAFDGSGLFMSIGGLPLSTGSQAVTSPDGITWTLQPGTVGGITPMGAQQLSFGPFFDFLAAGSPNVFPGPVLSNTTDQGATWLPTFQASVSFQGSASDGTNTWIGLADTQIYTSVGGGTFAVSFSAGITAWIDAAFGAVSGVTLSCNNPPPATLTVPYTHALLAIGGTAPYAFSITLGALPIGLTLDPSTGIISGTPTGLGISPFTAQVTDATTASAIVNCSINVLAPLAISCNNPPAGSLGVLYNHSVMASGGTPPYTFAIIAGGLPPGLSLNPANGLISGIPGGTGTFGFTVQVTDSLAATAQVDCSINITVLAVAQVSITIRGVKRHRCSPEDQAPLNLFTDKPHVPKRGPRAV